MKRGSLVAALGVALLVVAALVAWWTSHGAGAGAEKRPAPAAVAPGPPRGRDPRGARRSGGGRVARGAIAGAGRDPSGAAVAGAEVCGLAFSERLSEDDRRSPICATTGAGGRYRLDGLLPATYAVDASAPAFWPGAYRDASRKTGDLRLADGEERRGVDIVLRPGGVEVTGVVKDIGGGSIEGAWVQALSRRVAAPSYARSGADGSFRLWFAPGNVRLDAEADGYAAESKIAVAPGQTVEILLTPESVLAGRVVEVGSGAPVPGARVGIGTDTGWLADDQGRFRLTRLSPGRYKPYATAPDGVGSARESVLLGLGQTIDGVVVELHPAALLTGRVVTAGSGAACVSGSIRLFDPRSGRKRTGVVEEGAVEIHGVLPGSYEVEVECRGFRSEDAYPQVVVTAGTPIPPQTWTVQAGAIIRGTVLAFDGAPVGRVTLAARPVEGTPPVRGGGSSWSQPDGTFELGGLVGGTYRLSIQPAAHPAPDDPVTVTVADGGQASIEIRLGAEGELAGDVVDERGQPVAGVMVTSSGQDSRDRSRPSADLTTWTRDDGTFVLAGLSPGSYRVAALRRGSHVELRPPGVRDGQDVAARATVVAGQTARVHLVVESQTGAIRGRVVDGQGKPITDAFVDGERELEEARAEPEITRGATRWGWSRAPVLTDTDGNFALERLVTGTYTLRAYRRGGGEALAQKVAVGSRVTLAIRPTGSIAGTVRTAGDPPQRFGIELHGVGTGYTRGENFFRDGGAWVFRDVPAGSFEIAASAAEGRGQTHVELAEGQALTGVVIELAPGRP